MKERSFTLKSYQGGLALHIKPDAEMDVLLQELTEKFQKSRTFFSNMQVSLAITGKVLTEEEEEQILDIITENSDLQIVYLIGNDESLQYLFHQVQETQTEENPEEALSFSENTVSDGQFYRGTLKRGQSLETEHSVVILGDVNRGAKVFSKKDVIVLGSLLGEVHAGMDGEDGHFVCALEFSPDKLKIGSISYRMKPDKKLWPASHKKSPKMALLNGEEVIVKPVTKESLGEITTIGNDYISQ